MALVERKSAVVQIGNGPPDFGTNLSATRAACLWRRPAGFPGYYGIDSGKKPLAAPDLTVALAIAETTLDMRSALGYR